MPQRSPLPRSRLALLVKRPFDGIYGASGVPSLAWRAQGLRGPRTLSVLVRAHRHSLQKIEYMIDQFTDLGVILIIKVGR